MAKPLMNNKFARGHFNVKKEEVKDTKETLKKLWFYLEKEKKSFSIVILLIFIISGLNLLSPYLIALAIDKYILVGNLHGLDKIIIFLFFYYILIAFLSWLESYIMLNISQNIVNNLRKTVFSKLQTLPIAYFDKNKKGDLMSRLTNDIENISNVVGQSLAQLVYSFINITGAIIIMFILSWQLSLVTISTVPILISLVKFIGTFTRKHFKSLQRDLGSINAIVEEDISALKVIKAYGQEENRVNKFKVENDKLKKSAINAQIYSGLMGPSMNFISNIRFAIVVAFGTWFSLLGLISIGIITSFITYSRQFGRPLSQMAQLYNGIQSALAGAERVFEVLNEKSEFEEEGLKISKLKGNVIFQDVDFSYEKDNKILKKLSLESKSGESIALVGPTGAGKTTIVNLLSRFYEIDSGNIFIDGHDIRKLCKTSLRKRLGIVLQDTYLFSGSIGDNIRFGKVEASDKEVVEACKLANAHEFIERLPLGYETILSENGSNLSEGQRQLLAIARAILADHDILILDEATSNIDTRTEIKIQEALLNLMKGKTSFIIAHRLSTIRGANKILFIKDGKVEESGTHEELINHNSYYKELYMNQYR